MKQYHYFGLMVLPLLVVAGYQLGSLWNLLTPAFCFIVHPLVSLAKKRSASVAIAVSPVAENKDHSRLIPFCFVPVLAALFVWLLTRLPAVSIFETTLLAIATGTVNGVIGFTLAHEFIHRQSLPEKASGLLLLLINNYLHYHIEHIGGHHLYACTPKDPHTAMAGESFYRFLPRAIAGTYNNAWEIESNRLTRKGNSFFSIYNRMFIYSLAQISLYSFLFIFFGSKGLIFFFVQSSAAIFLLHMINYLQHYGLLRKEIVQGKFEKIAAQHSWNSGQSQQAFNLFQLEKHADHHMHPSHSYDELQHHHASPELPGGYTTMICLALVPPLWFRAINKRISLTINAAHHEINH